MSPVKEIVSSLTQRLSFRKSSKSTVLSARCKLQQIKPKIKGGKPRAIVHLGMPKTGTTAIQQWMHKNDHALRTRRIAAPRAHSTLSPIRTAHVEMGFCQCEMAGELMPYPVNRGDFGIHTRQDQSKFVEDYSTYFGNLISTLDVDTVLISNEDFSSMTRTPEMAAGLDKWLRQFFSDITYLIYVRRQEEYLASLYSQEIRGGAPIGLDTFLKRQQNHDLNKFVDPWVAVAGTDGVNIRIFDRDIFPNGSLLADFALAASIDVSGFPGLPEINESLGVASIAMLRSINRLEPRYIGNPPYRNPIARDLEWFLSGNVSGDRKFSLGPKMVENIRSTNAADNERFRAKYFSDMKELFPAKSKPDVGGPTNYYASPDELGHVAAQVIRGMRLGDYPTMNSAERNQYHHDRNCFAKPATDDTLETVPRGSPLADSVEK